MGEMNVVTQAECDELQRKISEACQTEEDMRNFLKDNMSSNDGNTDELNAEDLDLVVGGMSYSESVTIITTAYWDLCICGKSSSRYSQSQIDEAISVSSNATLKDQAFWVMRTTLKTYKRVRKTLQKMGIPVL